MKKEEKNIMNAGTRLGLLFGVILVTMIIIGINISDVAIVTEEQRWQEVYIWNPVGSEGNPGAGASGFLEIFFINHTASPTVAYLENTSSTLESWCTSNMAGKTPYANADNFNVELASEVSFDIVVRVRFNKTHAWETNKFIGSDTDCQITTSCTGWADGENDANTSATHRVESRNNTGEDYIWINFVWNADDNNGYQLADDGVLTISEIYIEAKF